MATQIKVTTTGTQSPVIINDLGAYTIPHPTTALDVITDGGFTFTEIQESRDFNAAITAGYITVTDANGNAITDSASQNVTASSLLGTALASNVVSSSLTSVGTLANLTVTNPISGSTTNNADRALSNLASVAINAALVLATEAAFDIGSTAKPWKDIWLAGSSDTPATNQFRITGASTGGVRTITLPDASGTVALTANKLSTFASTTSAELAGVISDETGSGALVFADSPTFAGTPSLPTGTTGITQATNDNSTKLATTAYVANAVAGAASASNRTQFFGDSFNTPVTADWAINALAPASADPTNSALIVRFFDDTAEEGVGGMLFIPTGITNITFTFMSRARTAPAATRTVGVKFYYRQLPDNAAISTWSSRVFTDVSIPTNDNFQLDTETFTLASFSPAISAGGFYQFELTRINPTAGTELVGDWALLSMVVEFS